MVAHSAFRHTDGVFAPYNSAPSRDDVVLFFEARTTGREAWQPGDEISEVAFLGRSELPEPMHPWQRTRVQDALQNASATVRVMAPID